MLSKGVTNVEVDQLYYDNREDVLKCRVFLNGDRSELITFKLDMETVDIEDIRALVREGMKRIWTESVPDFESWCESRKSEDYVLEVIDDSTPMCSHEFCHKFSRLLLEFYDVEVDDMNVQVEGYCSSCDLKRLRQSWVERFSIQTAGDSWNRRVKIIKGFLSEDKMAKLNDTNTEGRGIIERVVL